MYQLSLLPYLFQDLEPFITTHTIALHYLKHQQNYLDNLNKILNKNNYNYQYSLEELVFHVNEFPDVDRENLIFNLGGVINHDLYFHGISANGGLPVGRLMDKIKYQYGNYDNFWKSIKDVALKLKGSGYTFIVLNSNGNLEIINFSNQDIPLLFGYVPLFNIDMWEHAYYLDYQNDKSKYLDNFKKIADFTNASIIYDSISG